MPIIYEHTYDKQPSTGLASHQPGRTNCPCIGCLVRVGVLSIANAEQTLTRHGHAGWTICAACFEPRPSWETTNGECQNCRGTTSKSPLLILGGD